ncbi:MAG: YihY/virulence factor BrkB family protein [Chloroflexota bacterium]
MKNRLKQFASLVYESIVGVIQNWGAVHAAALSYTTLFSLGPLVIIIVVLTTRALNRSIPQEEILPGIHQAFGPEVGRVFQEIVSNSYDLAVNQVWTGIGIVFLFYAASSMFMQLRNSLNAMWGLRPRPPSWRRSVAMSVQSRLLSAGWVLVIGFLLPFMIMLNMVWAVVSDLTHLALPASLSSLRTYVAFFASPVLMFLSFALIFKILPQAKISWRDVFPGAGLTTLLFWIGTNLIGLYLTRSTVSSVYGFAGTLVFFLLWVYYSAWIILFGARFTMLYANRIGHKIVPYDHVHLIGPP